MYPNALKIISRCAALLSVLLGAALLAQVERAPAPRAAQEQMMVAPQDGRTVIVQGEGVKLSPAAIGKVQATFNRLTSRDLRSYPLGEILNAAERAAKEGVSAEPGGGAAARVKWSVTISCCPLKIVIIISF